MGGSLLRRGIGDGGLRSGIEGGRLGVVFEFELGCGLEWMRMGWDGMRIGGWTTWMSDAVTRLVDLEETSI